GGLGGYWGRIRRCYGAKTAENLCLDFGCREGKEFCKGLGQKNMSEKTGFHFESAQMFSDGIR
ncbi:TPA: hypothetical protein ACJJCX_002053, partial [Neisseria meningitidis]